MATSKGGHVSMSDWPANLIYDLLIMPPVRTYGAIVKERKSCKAKLSTSLTIADVLGFRFTFSRVLMEWLQNDYETSLFMVRSRSCNISCIELMYWLQRRSTLQIESGSESGSGLLTTEASGEYCRLDIETNYGSLPENEWPDDCWLRKPGSKSFEIEWSCSCCLRDTRQAM